MSNDDKTKQPELHMRLNSLRTRHQSLVLTSLW